MSRLAAAVSVTFQRMGVVASYIHRSRNDLTLALLSLSFAKKASRIFYVCAGNNQAANELEAEETHLSLLLRLSISRRHCSAHSTRQRRGKKRQGKQWRGIERDSAGEESTGDVKEERERERAEGNGRQTTSLKVVWCRLDPSAN